MKRRNAATGELMHIGSIRKSKAAMHFKKNDTIYILTEERPKITTIDTILDEYSKLMKDPLVRTGSGETKLRPVFADGKFLFEYEVENVHTQECKNIELRIVSGESSFMDFMIFRQSCPPAEGGKDQPIMAVEETKTADAQSRNTGIYQRATKFVYIRAYYPKVPCYMLYDNLDLKTPSDTNKFGTNLLLTLGVKFINKDMSSFSAFTTVDGLLKAKAKMKRPKNGQPLLITKKNDDEIVISARLAKYDNGVLNHDPNIGAVTLYAAALRELGWDKKITVSDHRLKQHAIDKSSGSNKLFFVCDQLNIIRPAATAYGKYWHYERSSEKQASILLHLLCLYHGDFLMVYENHAGCERGSFHRKDGTIEELPKKVRGDKLYIPDVVLYDETADSIWNVEGKRLVTLAQGLKEINNYDLIENEFFKKGYPGATITRWFSIFGGNEKAIPDDKVLIYLAQNGKTIISKYAPNTLKDIAQEFGIQVDVSA